ncbi:hypothetical protein C8J56DRAFT_976354 [Mycena floridula]|nr:hypothetical protein C8J56DRAFT_976354 [Mycena floridula]
MQRSHSERLLDCFGRLLTANNEVWLITTEIGVLLQEKAAPAPSSRSSSHSSSKHPASAIPSSTSPVGVLCPGNVDISQTSNLDHLLRSMRINETGMHSLPPRRSRRWNYGPNIPTPEAIRLQVERMEEGPLYVVTRGYAIGVFAEWAIASLMVNGASGNSHKRVESKAEAIRIWTEAYNDVSPVPAISVIPVP